MTGEQRTELIINALEIMVETLKYLTVCTSWIPQMFTQEQNKLCMQVCQQLLKQYAVEGGSFLDCIIAGDKMWCEHNRPESTQQSI